MGSCSTLRKKFLYILHATLRCASVLISVKEITAEKAHQAAATNSVGPAAPSCSCMDGPKMLVGALLEACKHTCVEGLVVPVVKSIKGEYVGDMMTKKA